MKKYTIVSLLVIIAAISFYLITQLSYESGSDDIILKNHALEQEESVLSDVSDDIRVEVRDEEIEIFGPVGDPTPGTGYYRTTQIPYLIIDGETIAIFGDNKYLRVRDYSFSLSNKYLYLSMGQISQDASVSLYIYDIENRTLHVVCDKEVCGGYEGFPSQDDIEVSWSSEHRLLITFDNPFLVEGAGEGGPAVGPQNFISVSSEKPWIVKEEQ